MYTHWAAVVFLGSHLANAAGNLNQAIPCGTASPMTSINPGGPMMTPSSGSINPGGPIMTPSSSSFNPGGPIITSTPMAPTSSTPAAPTQGSSTASSGSSSGSAASSSPTPGMASSLSMEWETWMVWVFACAAGLPLLA